MTEQTNTGDTGFKIDRNVPLPPARATDIGILATARKLEVGDSFFVPGKDSQALHSRVHRLKPRKFSVRTETLKGVKGTRVWRVM